MIRTLSACICLAAIGAGCVSAPRFTRLGQPNELLASPPAGKALVNFHRPSGYGGGAEFPVYDRDRLIGNSFGACRFQYVCDPGEHVFIGSADHVSVIQADLKADKVYDVVVDITMGWWQANITLAPIGKANPRRPVVPEWEAKEKLLVPVQDATSGAWEDRMRPNNQRILADFMGGPKAERVVRLAADDCR